MKLPQLAIVLSGTFILAAPISSHAKTVKKQDPSDLSYASVAPMPGAFGLKPMSPTDRLKEIEKIDKDYVFIRCDSESDCLRKVQDAETENGESATSQSVAEYIAGPQRGMAIYKKPVGK